MAIEITPRIKIKVPSWTIIVGAVLLILLFALIAVYFYFAFSLKKISQELEEKNSTIVVPLEESIRKKEGELEPISERINDFNKLLIVHEKTLDIFTFLERTCLPTIWFSDFVFDSEIKKVNVSGEVDNFITLEQQISILRKESVLRSSDIIEVLIDEDGNINFTLSLIFR